MTKLLYPTSLRLDVARLEGLGVILQPYDVDAPFSEEDVDADYLVTWFNSKPNLNDAAARLHRLRWVQSLSAGANDILAAGFGPRVVLTGGSGLHNQTVAEHALGLILNAARRFFEVRDCQLQGQWPAHLGGKQPDRPADAFTTLRDADVLIWGFGNIARELAPLLQTLGARVRGIARHAGVRSGIQVYSEVELSALLPGTDVLIMILPGSPDTKHALSAERLKLLPKHAWVVNVGRGSSIKEQDLCAALERKEIGGAALDVFETEPLPTSSPLWKAPNFILSPHGAGGRPRGSEELIADNLRKIQAGQRLKNVLR